MKLHKDEINHMNKKKTWLSSWPTWIGYAAGIWSFIYLLLGLYWTWNGKSFPFGVGDPHSEYSILAGLQPTIGAPITAVFGLIGIVVSWMIIKDLGGRMIRLILSILIWIFILIVLIAIMDFRLLGTAAYSIVFLLGAPFDFPKGASYFGDVIYWTVFHQYFCLIGVVLWILSTLVYQRRGKNSCEACGRTKGSSIHKNHFNFGKGFTYSAIIIPIGYSLTRWAFYLGIPLGTTQAFLEKMERETPNIWLYGALLGSVAIGGAILTSGLIQRWGEVFPRWIPFLAGKPVPLPFAIIPASLVSIMVTSAGFMYWRVFFESGSLGSEGWSMKGPEMLWPFWGVALAGATLNYYYRRRGRCTHCNGL